MSSTLEKLHPMRLHARRSGQRHGLFNVGAAEHAITFDVGINDSFDAQAGNGNWDFEGETYYLRSSPFCVITMSFLASMPTQTLRAKPVEEFCNVSTDCVANVPITTLETPASDNAQRRTLSSVLRKLDWHARQTGNLLWTNDLMIPHH